MIICVYDTYTHTDIYIWWEREQNCISGPSEGAKRGERMINVSELKILKEPIYMWI
jgi:hypothetical protein